MATVTWRGDALAVAQVDELTPGGTIEVGDIFTVTIGIRSVSVSATGTTVASVCTDLAEALEASEYPEFAEITWEDNTTSVLATADTAGKPFVLSVSTTEADASPADAQTFSAATLTDSEGPEDWSTAGNWSGNAVPVNNDTVYLTGTGSIRYGLDQSGVSLTALHVTAGFTGELGLPNVDADGDYRQYRDTYLKVGGTPTVNIGQGLGPGSGRVKIHHGSGNVTVNVFSSAQAASDPDQLPAVCLQGGSASSVLNCYRGTIGLCLEPAQTSTFTTVQVGHKDNPTNDVTLTAGTGATLTTITQDGGNLLLLAGVTTLNLKGGTAEAQNAAAITTLTAVPGTNQGCTFKYNSSGTIGTLTLGNKATLDASGDLRARAITNATLMAGCTMLDPSKKITWSNAFTLSNCGLEDVTLKVGKGLSVTRS